MGPSADPREHRGQRTTASRVGFFTRPTWRNRSPSRASVKNPTPGSPAHHSSSGRATFCTLWRTGHTDGQPPHAIKSALDAARLSQEYNCSSCINLAFRTRNAGHQNAGPGHTERRASPPRESDEQPALQSDAERNAWLVQGGARPRAPRPAAIATTPLGTRGCLCPACARLRSCCLGWVGRGRVSQ